MDRGIRCGWVAGCATVALLVAAFQYFCWRAMEGYTRPHTITDTVELWEMKHFRLPAGARLVSGRQWNTPGENQVWVALEMPTEEARAWLKGDAFRKTGSEAEYRRIIEQEMGEAWGEWPDWRPKSATRVVVREALYEARSSGPAPRQYQALVLADVSGPRARVYLYWMG